jgi:hypothetical protein
MDTLVPVSDLTYAQLSGSGRVRGDALFSACGLYRHWLSRTWDANRPYVNFLLLNPSKATAELTDNTMERCNCYAFDWGYGGQWTTNAFDFRATYPTDMKAHPKPASDDCDRWIVEVAKKAAIVVCGWGTDGEFLGRGAHVISLLRENGITPHCLKKTKSGLPNHPLYLRKTLRPIPCP